VGKRVKKWSQKRGAYHRFPYAGEDIHDKEREKAVALIRGKSQAKKSYQSK